MSTPFKYVITILILGVIAVIAMAQEHLFTNRKASPMSGDENTIRNMIETQYPGFVRSGDAGGYASQFTDDALWIPPGENNHKGPQAIAESLNEEFKTVQLHPVMTVQEVSILGDHAYVIAKDELTIIPKDGNAESQVVYTVFWLLRKVDNQWKIARQIWNEKPVED